MNEEYTTIKILQYRGCGFMTISKYDNDGNIIYIGDKDSKKIIGIDTTNYQIIKTFNGHNGIVWSLDISKDDSILISASGDLTIGFFSTKNNTMLFQSNENCIPKYVCTQKKNLETNLVGIICEALTRKSTTYIVIYDLDLLKNESQIENYDQKFKLIWKSSRSKPTVLEWISNDELIIGCEDGKIILRNINDLEGENEKEFQIHTSTIKSIVWNKSNKLILTSSLDCTSKQIDPYDEFKIISIFVSTVPINHACWNYNEKKVILGGGIEAMNVAKTSDNDLNLKIYRLLDQKLTNHISSHFGPIRYIDKAPNSKNFITASQDGSVKIYLVDKDLNDKINFENLNNKLISETGKIINLNWKPPKIKEEKVQKWIPGMPKQLPNDKSNLENFKVSDSNIEINKKLDEFKKNDKEECSTIRITNLPFDIKNKDLYDIFDLYGRIEERGIKIKNYGDTTMAFIKYTFPESALKAIENADGLNIDHCIIMVEMAKSSK